VEPEVGFEPATFRLRVEEPSSSRYQPGRFWLLRSAGSFSQCVPDLPSYGRENDRENDCETAQGFGDDAGLEPVAAGVTLRMTDPVGCLALDLSTRCCRRRPGRSCWPDVGA
jgi:hypothetical protein